ncbi:MAG: sterol desaturase family protein [Bdellovibrionales bacterium]|nr:sterol desaturase family protein [Bdellovibrionales bacterium]
MQQERKEIIVLSRNADGTLRIFGPNWMERHSHVHPITPLLVWVPFIAFLIWNSVAVLDYTWPEMALIGAVALFVWTFAEYVLHRWVFHFKPWNENSRKVSYLIHWVHHDAPADKTRLVMPPVAGIVLALILYGVFRLALGASLVQPFFAFFLIGYLAYDYTHYAVHHFRPRTFIGRHLKKHHMDHHYAFQESNWGVSSALWDHVFGTTSAKARARARRTGATGEGASLDTQSTA